MYSANSYLRLQDSTHSGGDISIGATNSIYVMGGSLSTSSADAIAIGAQANMHLDGVTIGNNPATAEIDIGTFGILSHGGANFSSRGINCSTPGSFDVNDGIAIGTQTGC